MFGSGPSYQKLKTNLRLAINRLKLLEKKKTELALKARKEIADYIANGKEERARIRVEHIVREDYMVEAMELVEMYCDQLLARFGLVQQMKTLDEGLQETISSLIWVAPRMQADVAELKIIADQLTMKYGKTFAEASHCNSLRSVNEKLMLKLSPKAPPRILVERYMVEIAKSHNVPFEPDHCAMDANEACVAEGALIDFEKNNNNNNNQYPGGPGGGGGGGMPFSYPPPYYPGQPAATGGGELYPNLPPPPGPGWAVPPNPYPESSLNNLPSYNSVTKPQGPPQLPSAPPVGVVPAGCNEKLNLELPNLPSVPANSFPKVEDNEVDFDDLTKRFEELKKKK